MKKFQKKIVIEKAELNMRIKELSNFINSDGFNKISDTDKTLMKSQIFYMNEYLKILEERVKNFEIFDYEEDI